LKWKISFAFCGRILKVLRQNPGRGWGDCFASLATAKNTAGLLRFARNDGESIRRIASLCSQRPTKKSLRGRIFVSEAVSPQRFLAALRLGMTDEECHCEPRFFALFLCHCELVVSSAKQSHEVASSLRSSQRREIRPPTFASSLRSSQVTRQKPPCSDKTESPSR